MSVILYVMYNFYIEQFHFFKDRHIHIVNIYVCLVSSDIAPKPRKPIPMPIRDYARQAIEMKDVQDTSVCINIKISVNDVDRSADFRSLTTKYENKIKEEILSKIVKEGDHDLLLVEQ